MSLKDAWYVFAHPELKARLGTNEGPAFDPSATTLEKFQLVAHSVVEIARLQAARKEAVEFLREQLAAGELVATGLPPPDGRKFQRVAIEDAFWDAATIDAAKGTASAMGVGYVAVQVSRPPVTQREMAEARELKISTEHPRAIEPVASDFPSMAGATSFEDIRAKAILYCFQTYKDFERFKLERRLEMVLDYVDTNHPEIDTSRGFDRSSFYSTVKKLKAGGLLPSKNVQE